MSTIAPAPVKPPEVSEKLGGGKVPPNGHGDGNGSGNGHRAGWPEEAPNPQHPTRRRSIWPLLLDLGQAMALFGLIITGRFLIVIGAVIFLVALTGWLREARADYSRLKD